MKYKFLPLKISNRLVLTLCFNVAYIVGLAQLDSFCLKNKSFIITCSNGGISGIRCSQDTFATNFVYKGENWVVAKARFQLDGHPDSLFSSSGQTNFLRNRKLVNYQYGIRQSAPLRFDQTFNLEDSFLIWHLQLTNTTSAPINVQDLAISFSYNNEESETPTEIFEQRVLQHKFISGNNSFVFWERPSGIGPYLLMVPDSGSSFEYFKRGPFNTNRNTSQLFIHAGYSAQNDLGNWRQPISSLLLKAGTVKSYTFKFRWAQDYNDIRRLLVQEGLLDVHVSPGMTIPTNLSVNLALRSRQTIKTLQAEFPKTTRIHFVGLKKKDTYVYQISFRRLGENRLTVKYGDKCNTYLEFFVTEPLENLYKKRAAFIVQHQQHRDSTKWYNGLFSVWDMKTGQLRGPDNDDGFNRSRLTYLLTCDDPILCKAPFVAAKNVFFPNQQEIDALEYHIKNYVWGGLQRTDKEKNPYGVYGTPNWLIGRDSIKRASHMDDPNRNKMHIWRSYDYPHIIMMYYHMYQIAAMYPGMTHYLDSTGYLMRAKETAKAYFTYPYSILPWYETYKWGCYNEIVIPDLITDLKKHNYLDDAKWLTGEWEKKVKYFIYDDKYPFRSEYAVDATAYESTEVFAKYAMTTAMASDTMLWFDKNLNKWYSHPHVNDAATKRFLVSQMQANIASRGYLEPAYYYLGSDFRGSSDNYLLSYMAQMGGWSIIDYGLHFAEVPNDYLQLGYASYLSSFALLNTGYAGSNYGFWYPGKQNDGATGWAFEPQSQAVSWIGKKQSRGPWYYDGEIDLGFGAATRTAATIIVNDSIFGWTAYGANLSKRKNILSFIPGDGLRRRLFYRVGDKKIDIELSRDGFSKNPIYINTDFININMKLENRTMDDHCTYLNAKGLEGTYALFINNHLSTMIDCHGKSSVFPINFDKDWKTVSVEIKRMKKAESVVNIIK